MRHPCRGWPEGHACPVIVAPDRLFCSRCKSRRQEAIASGLPESGMVPVGIVLEDFEAPVPVCQCGGDPTANQHELSLLHMKWAWAQRGLRAKPVDHRKFA